MTSQRLEPGSFRDREGRVFYREDKVYRALSPKALEDWRALEQTAFFQRAQQDGRVVATSETDAAQRPDDDDEALSWAGVLEHERVPLISYPSEWSFGMLRDAALLQLDLLLDALEEGFVLKDSSAFNVQWRGTDPVFIDVPSFQRLEPGEPWVGYLQFCQQFLYPLLLTAHKDVPFNGWLRGQVDGLQPADMSALFSGLGRFRRGVFTHVFLQAKLAAATADAPRAVRNEARELGFSAELIKNNARRMRKLVAGLEWKRSSSEWSSYGSSHNYSEEEHRAKESFVARAAASRDWHLLWDVGCNDGRFTRVAAAHCREAVAVDIDPLVVDRLYQDLRSRPVEGARVLPLVGDVADPTPARGWRGLERASLQDRMQPDLLLALALVHHLVIGRNVPTAQLVEWLASFGCHLIVEFPTRRDSMVKRLLLNKEDHYDDYRVEFFEERLARHFEILERQEQAEGERVLYFVSPGR